MARKRSPALTDGELRIMRVLWARGHGTVSDVIDELAGPRRPAYNTVLTMLRILEDKNYVTHQKAGRAFVYRPLINQGTARRTALKHLLSRFFDDSAELLVLNLLEHDDLDEAELQRVRALVEHEGASVGKSRT